MEKRERGHLGILDKKIAEARWWLRPRHVAARKGKSAKHIGVNTHKYIYIYTDVCAADLVLEKSV